MATYLVTGGAGFIGSNIVEELLKRGQKVRVLDNFSTGKRENILPFLDKIKLIEGDIRDYRVVREAVDGVDFILHQAALPSVLRSVKDPIMTNEVNVGGTLNILDAAKNAGVKRIVYASSSSVYGNSEILPKSEDMSPEPISPYAVSKLAGERYCRVFYEVYGLETVILRYFNIFGPRQDPNSQYSAVIPKFIVAMKRGERPVIHGDGKQSRDFTYVANVVEANFLACEADNVSREILNVASGERFTVLNLVDELNKIARKDISPKFQKERKGDVRHSLADITKADKMLGFSPHIDLHEGLRMTMQHYGR